MSEPILNPIEDRLGLVGRNVLKRFGKHMYPGVISFVHTLDGFAEGPPIYRVVYADGDCEDLEEHDVQAVLVANELKQGPTATTTPQHGRTKQLQRGSAQVQNGHRERLERLNGLVERIVQAAEDAALDQHGSSSFELTGGQVSLKRPRPVDFNFSAILPQLYQEVVGMRASAAMHMADVSLLLLLLKTLDDKARQGCAINVFRTAWQIADTSAPITHLDSTTLQAVLTLQTAVQAAVVGLMVITSPRLDRQLLNEEFIEDSVQLLRHHAEGHLSLALDPSLADKLANQGANQSSEHSVSINTSRCSAINKLVARQLLKNIGQVYELCSMIEELLRSARVEDKVLLQLCATCTGILAMDCAAGDVPHRAPLLHSALNILQLIFASYHTHRDPLLDDIVVLLSKMPAAKRQLRTHQVSSGRAVQTGSVLIMLVVHAAVLQHPTSSGAITTSGGRDVMRERSLSAAVQSSGTLLRRLLDRCARKEDGPTFRPLLVKLVDDLLECAVLPEWPAAEMLLETLTRLLLRDLAANRGKASALGLESQYCQMALDLLGRIAQFLVGVQQQELESPMALPQPMQDIPADGTPMDEAESVRCLCGGPDIGTLMLDCDRCHRWFHGKCVGVEQEADAPTQWFCPDCKVLQQVSWQQDALVRQQQRRMAKDDAELAKIRAYQETACSTMSEAGMDGEQSGGGVQVADLDMFKQLLLNFLTHQARSDQWVATARLVHLARWMDAANDVQLAGTSEALLGLWKEQWDMPTQSVDGTGWDDCAMDQKGAKRLTRALFCAGGLSKAVPTILSHVLALTAEESASIRARAVKTLSIIVEADPTLMAKDLVQQAVRGRFQDEAISVRQAAVDLVGKYVILGGRRGLDLLRYYYDALMERLLDRGVSVRKSVVIIMRTALLRQPNHPCLPAICRALVERASAVKEEDTIRDAISATLQEIWFHAPPEDDKPGLARTASGMEVLRDVTVVPTGSRVGLITPSKGEELTAQTSSQHDELPPMTAEQVLEASVIQMMDVVAGMKDPDWLVNLLKDLIFPPAESRKQRKDNPKRREATEAHCRAQVACLINVLLRLDEGVEPATDGTPGHLATPEGRLMAALSTLHVFCRANPLFLEPHMGTLYPYLGGENGLQPKEEAAVCRTVAAIILEVLPCLQKPDVKILQQAAHNLLRLTYSTFSSQVVDIAVQCLARMILLVGLNSDQMFALLQYFYQALWRVQAAVKLNKQDQGLILRGLLVVGCICRYQHFPEDVLNEEEWEPQRKLERSLPGSLEHGHVREPVFEMLVMYLKHSDHAIQVKALQGLTFLLIGSPRLTLKAEQAGLVSMLLSSGTQPGLIAQALWGWKDILEAEEERVRSGVARTAMEQAGVSIALRVQGDQDAESSVAGGVLQSYLHNILRLTFHLEEAVRVPAITLLGVMLRQGLLMPLEAIPHLIALQGDMSGHVRGEALKQLLLENEKGKDYIRLKLLEGVFLACRYQAARRKQILAILPCESGSWAVAGAQSIFAAIYSTCIRPDRKHRVSLLRQCLGLFDIRKAAEVQKYVEAADQSLSGKMAMSNVKTSTQSASGGRRASHTPVPRTLLPMNLPALAFLTQTLAHLPYEVQEEPLDIIHHISRQVSSQAAQLLDELRTALQRQGLPLPPEMLSLETEVDCYSSPGTKKPPHSAHADRELLGMKTGSGQVRLEDLCGMAAALCMLLRLKAHLIHIYGFSDMQRQRYKPEEGNKATHKKLPCRPAAVNMFPVLTSYCQAEDQSALQHTTALCVEFCRLLQEESGQGQECSYPDPANLSSISLGSSRKARRKSTATVPTVAESSAITEAQGWSGPTHDPDYTPIAKRRKPNQRQSTGSIDS